MLSRDDLKTLFDPVVRQAIALVQQQVNDAAKTGHSIDVCYVHIPSSCKANSIQRMILVGGFGDSPYLFNKLQHWCKMNGNIHLVCPEHPQAAIVLGASLRGLCGTAPSSTRCRRHYGYTLGYKFRPGLDREEDSFVNPFAISDTYDGKMCRGRMAWIIGKGWEITSQTTKSISLYNTHETGDSLLYSLNLYATGLDTAPDRHDDDRVEKVGCMEINYSGLDLSECPTTFKNGKLFWRLDFELRIEFGASKGVLDFSSWVKGKRSGTARINYGKK